jgi:hypothetical protein
MFKFTKGILSALAIQPCLMSAAATFAQTTGSVTMNATVSNFVELNSGGAVTLTGNSGGSVITDGTANSPAGSGCKPGRIGPKQHQQLCEIERAAQTSQQRSLSTQYG